MVTMSVTSTVCRSVIAHACHTVVQYAEVWKSDWVHVSTKRHQETVAQDAGGRLGEGAGAGAGAGETVSETGRLGSGSQEQCQLQQILGLLPATHLPLQHCCCNNPRRALRVLGTLLCCTTTPCRETRSGSSHLASQSSVCQYQTRERESERARERARERERERARAREQTYRSTDRYTQLGTSWRLRCVYNGCVHA